MKKKWSVLVLLILLAVLAGLIVPAGNSPAPILIRGNPPPQDVKAMKAAVRKDMLRRILPHFSWANLKALPANLRTYFKCHIVEINAVSSWSALVSVGDSTNAAASTRGCEYLVIKSRETGWRVSTIYLRSYPRIGMALPAVAPPGFPTNLSPRPFSMVFGPPITNSRGMIYPGIPERRMRTAPVPLASNLHFSANSTIALSPPGLSNHSAMLPPGLSTNLKLILQAPYARSAVTFSAPTMTVRVIPSTSSVSLTNLLPAGP